MKNKWWVFLLILVLLKGIVWMMFVPIFQVPDEPSHFSIIQFLAVNGRRPHPRRESFTAKELLDAAQIVNFDWQIKHPVWRGYEPEWRRQLAELPLSDREIFFDNAGLTSLKRPPLYYYLAVPFYWLVGVKPFIVTFFSVRFFSSLISLGIFALTYLIAYRFIRHRFLALATAMGVAFQPMFSYISAGVQYDPLAILLATAFIFCGQQYLYLKRKFWLTLALISLVLGVMTKPDLLALGVGWFWLLKAKTKKVSLFIFAGLMVLLAAMPMFFSQLINQDRQYNLDFLLYLTNLNEYIYHARFFLTEIFSGAIWGQLSHYLTVTAPLHWAQLFPWYWGVFGWLEVTLPLVVYRVIKIVTVFALLGLIQAWRRQAFKRRELLFFLVTALAHALVVVGNDFKIFTVSGSQFGIQGRYLLPMLSLHWLFLVLGLTYLTPKKFLSVLATVLIVAVVGLNITGLFTIYHYFGWVWGK